MAAAFEDRVRGKTPGLRFAVLVRELADLAGAAAAVRRREQPDIPGDSIPRRSPMTFVWQDVKYAARVLRQRPTFSLAALLILSLGIGANTAIFSVVKAVVLTPLPYADPDRVAMIWGKIERGSVTNLSGPEVHDYTAEAGTFTNVAVYADTASILTGGGEPERVAAGLVSPNTFETLGIPAMAGRAFLSSDDAAKIADQVVLSDTLWRRRFGGSRDIVGQRIIVDGSSSLVVGVMPAAFRLPLDFGDDRPSEIWRPLDLRSPQWAGWGNHSLIGFARLRDGVSPSMATATMRKLEDRWIQDRVGGGWNDRDIQRRAAVPVKDLVLGDVSYSLWILLGAVGVILIIACANVANLMLANADERRREIAVRMAIGASRPRIARLLLIEGVLLSTSGGVVGIGIAFIALRALLAFGPTSVPRIGQVGLDTGVLLFTLLVSIATGVLFGSAPVAELSRPDLNRSLKESGRTGTVGRGSQRFRDGLVVAQMALSVVLLIGAFLLLRSFMALERIALGFNPDSALTVRITLPPKTYSNGTDAIRMIRAIRQQIADLPGVRAVGATRLLPLTGTIGNWSITQEDHVKQPGENPNGDWQVVTPGYFESMGIPLVRGRTFSDSDNEHSPIVAVISQTMAERYWPGEDALGKRFSIGGPAAPWITVVGLVGHVRHSSLIERPRAEMYVPHAQWAAAGASTRLAMTFVIRTAGDPLAILPRVRGAVRSLDPLLPLSEGRTLRHVAGDALSQARFATTLLALFAGLALALAALGIYGLISLLIVRRRREIGIRMALGARSREILLMVVGRGMMLVAVGLVVGLTGAGLLTRVLSSLLYGVRPFDPATYIEVPAILAGVAVLACAIPARRAAHFDPITALRQE